MTEKTYREALTDALHQEMARDENVIVMGEDVVGGSGSPHAEPGFVGGGSVMDSAKLIAFLKNKDSKIKDRKSVV